MCVCVHHFTRTISRTSTAGCVWANTAVCLSYLFVCDKYQLPHTSYRVSINAGKKEN